MRKLAVGDKAKANQIANECGAHLISDLRCLTQCQLKLLHPKDEFFSDLETGVFKGKPRSINSDIPILYLCNRKSS